MKANQGTRRNTSRSQRRVTPLRLQMHVAECGAACLASILGYYGRWVSLGELRERCEVSRDGSTAAGLVRAGRSYGLECIGRSVGVRHLNSMPFPLILFWGFNHFLILEGIEGDSYYLNDPATGHRRVTGQEFKATFTGIVLQFRPGPEFTPGGYPSQFYRQAPEWLKGNGGSLALILACGALLSALVLAVPLLLGLFVDQILLAGVDWGWGLAAAMVAASLLIYVLTLLKRRFMRRLTIRISVIAANEYLTKLFRLPIKFFHHRYVGELTDRVLSIDRIAGGLSAFLLETAIEIILAADRC